MSPTLTVLLFKIFPIYRYIYNILLGRTLVSVYIYIYIYIIIGASLSRNNDFAVGIYIYIYISYVRPFGPG